MSNVVELIIRGNDQSGKSIASAVKNLEGMGSAFGAIRSSLAGIVSIGAFASLGREALQMGDSISKASEKLGIGAEKLSAMMYAAGMSDVSLEGFEKSMRKFSQAVIEVNAAGSDAATAFSVLGIATKDAEGKTLPLDVLFSKVADRFMQMEDGAGKVSLAVALFGRSGMDLIPILNKGAAGIAGLEGEAKRFGATLSGDTAKKLETANDNLKVFWMSVKGTAASITGVLVGALMSLGEALKYSGYVEGEGFDIPGPDAKRFKAPPLPAKIAAPNIDLIKKQAEEAKALREKYEKLDFSGQVAFAEAMVQANDDMAKALADINKKYWEDKDKEDERYQQMDFDGWVAYAEAVVQANDDMAKALSDANIKYWEDQKWANQAIKDFVVNGFNDMADALATFVTTGKLNFRDFVNSAISDLARLLVKMSMFKLLSDVGLGEWMGIPVPSGRASGGPVFAGTPYVVGERGPELFVPGASGSIIPNGAGGGNVTVNIRNEGGQQVQAKSARASFDAQGAIIDIVIDGINRNVHGLRTVLGGA